jgi:23S rRNA-/tRNA-specific pseudouridylate synthase
VHGPEVLRPIAFPRHALHAFQLVFRHPVDERPIDLTVPPPADFADLLSRLRV